jgi:hypothetical protein
MAYTGSSPSWQALRGLHDELLVFQRSCARRERTNAGKGGEGQHYLG